MKKLIYFLFIAANMLPLNSLYSKTINVVSYGADVSGVSDSYTAITNAHNAAVYGDTVYFPNGKYLVGVTFKAYYLFTMKSGVTWLGQDSAKCSINMPFSPPGQFTRFMNSNTGSVIDKAVFKNLRFDGCNIALRFEDTKNCLIDHCTFFNGTVMLFATLEIGRYGNTGTRILNCSFDNPDYQDKKNNPTFDPTRKYLDTELAQFRYWNQFLIRFQTFPWQPNTPGTSKNDDILVKDCFFRGGTYNTIEVAGDHNTNIVISKSVFRDCYGVAIDFDKGAKYCTALDNEIYNMKPTQQHSEALNAVSFEMEAITPGQNGGDVDMASTNNRVENNSFKQTNIPYTKLKSRDGYNCIIKNNKTLPGDLGGTAMSITYSDLRSGTATDSTLIDGNIFKQGDIIFGGTSGGSDIAERIVLRNNEFHGRIQFFSKVFRSIEFLDNNKLWLDNQNNPAFKINTGSAIKKLKLYRSNFYGSGRTIDINNLVDVIDTRECLFEGNATVYFSPTQQADIMGNTFSKMSGDPAVSGTCKILNFKNNTFCQCTSPKLFTFINCNNLVLVNNFQGSCSSTAYATTGSVISSQSGNYWQGGGPANCSLSTSIGNLMPKNDNPGTAYLSIYPNPANESSTIAYQISEISEVKISVYDVLGREVMQVANEKQSAGEHHLNINTEQLQNGIYFVKMNLPAGQAGVNGETLTQKLIINK